MRIINGVKFFKTSEVAKILKTSSVYVIGLIKKDVLKGRKIGKPYLVSEPNLNEFLRINTEQKEETAEQVKEETPVQ